LCPLFVHSLSTLFVLSSRRVFTWRHDVMAIGGPLLVVYLLPWQWL
jgi:hypothetical protein